MTSLLDTGVIARSVTLFKGSAPGLPARGMLRRLSRPERRRLLNATVTSLFVSADQQKLTGETEEQQPLKA